MYAVLGRGVRMLPERGVVFASVAWFGGIFSWTRSACNLQTATRSKSDMIRKDRTASLQLLGSSFDWKSLFSSIQMCFISFWAVVNASLRRRVAV
jgi:hypothetical protein